SFIDRLDEDERTDRAPVILRQHGLKRHVRRAVNVVDREPRAVAEGSEGRGWTRPVSGHEMNGIDLVDSLGNLRDGPLVRCVWCETTAQQPTDVRLIPELVANETSVRVNPVSAGRLQLAKEAFITTAKTKVRREQPDDYAAIMRFLDHLARKGKVFRIRRGEVT